MKRLACCMGLALCACSLAFSQSSQSSPSSQGFGAFPTSPATQTSRERELTANELQRNLLLALSSPDYRVTPGDVYALSYIAGTAPVALRIVVDSSYRAQIANLGAVSAAGKTYRQLKAEAEAIVSNNYPLGGAQLTLVQVGYFRVYLAGEVQAATTKTAWALARLSSLLEGSLTEYS